MITTNILQRIFHIEVGDSKATCFTIDVNGKQYIVTAKHLVEKNIKNATIRIYHNKEWKKIEVALVGHCENGIDVSVLATNFQLSPTYALEPTSGGIVYGQEVFFLGFPYGMTGEIGALNRDFPMPFVKKAIVSCIQIKKDEPMILFLDGHNNPGFSGGPVVFKDSNQPNLKVAAVISGFKTSIEPVYQADETMPLEYRCNTGIVISYGIRHAVDLININPIGYELKI